MEHSNYIKHYNIPYKNLYDTLLGSASKYPYKPAVIDDHETVTYKELLNRVDELSESLQINYGMKEHDRAGVLMLNTVNMIAVFYALMKIGCVAVLINTKFRGIEIQNILDEIDVKVVFSDDIWRNKIEDYLCKKHIPLLTQGNNFGRCPVSDKHNAVQNIDDTAVIMQTSGTTGKPKGIMVSQQNIIEAVYGYQEVQKITQDDIAVLSVPIFHILGLAGVTALMMYVGATEVLSDYYHVDEVLCKIHMFHATHFHSVPAIYQQLIESDYFDKDLSSLKTAVCGGAIVSDDVIDDFCRLAPNAKFIRAYGMTETAGSGALSCIHREPLKAVPNASCFIVNSKHKQVPCGTMGEVVICGPCIAQKRWKSEDLPDQCEYSGDVGYMDEENHIFIVDRLKDLINRGGEKIFPMQIEQLIQKYPGVKEASVYAVSDKKFGEVPYAAIVIEKDYQINSEELMTFIKKNIATYETPVHIDIVKDFPRTQNGKVKKIELRRQAEALLEVGKK